jgi:glycerol-3-phosphate dehydrogenase
MTRLPSAQFDVIIVGGGIIGAGIARDAALRGLSTALFERRDYASGTTSGSTRLIHGGLRYLEMLDFALVRMDLRERETLLRIAPHLVKPLEFFLPFYEGGSLGPLEARTGMLLYDALSFDKSLHNHRHLTAAQVLQEEPGLREAGLRGAVSYYDAQVNSPERLAIENIVDARAHGAVTLNYAEVTAATRDGVRVKDLLSSDEAEVRGRVVVNASGPWFDRVAARLEPHPRPLVRTTKGIHLAHRPVNRHALALTSHIDRRLFFIIPWLDYSWIGTTDTDFRDDPGEARATPEDGGGVLSASAGGGRILDQRRRARAGDEARQRVGGLAAASDRFRTRAGIGRGRQDHRISRHRRRRDRRRVPPVAVARAMPHGGRAVAGRARRDAGRRPFAGALRQPRGGRAAPG